MKEALSKIYRELAAGRLTGQEAMARIKALNGAPAAAVQTLFATPRWERAPSLQGNGTYATHHMLLVGFPEAEQAALAAAMPGARCTSVPDDGDDVAQAYSNVALACFDALRRILRDKPAGTCLVQLAVTDTEEHRLLAGLAGMLETATLENPNLIGQLVFVRAGMPPAEIARCLRAEAEAPADCVVRYTGQERQVRRWSALAAPADAAPCPYREGGVYLVTGGLGGLGTLVARDILRTAPSAHVVLAGRANPDAARLEELRRDGDVSYVQADVVDAAQATRLLETVVRRHGKLHGIVHSAGIARDDFLVKKTPAQFAEVLGPKVAGAANLDRSSAGMALDFVALFSSIASWSGNVGQADYAAANGFLDAYAQYRNGLVAAGQRHGRTVAIAWPHWLEGGMHVDADSRALLERRTGLRSLDTATGLAALRRCLASEQGALMVMHGEPATIAAALQGRRMAQPAVRQVTQAAAPAAGVAAQTGTFLRGEFAVVLKIPAERIDTSAALEQYGIDSILAMKLTSRLEATFGVLPKTLFFEYRTIDELTEYFVRSHGGKLSGMFGATAPVAAAAPAPQPRQPRGRQRSQAAPAQPPRAATSEPIAIVGLSGRYPNSPDLAAFWRNLRDGVDCIVEVPASRWDWRQYYSEDRGHAGAHYSKWGGFIDGVDEFDPRFFNIAPREAAGIDPQERLFLQHAWMAIEDAGYTRAALQIPDANGLPGQVGVYAGVMYGEYNVSGTLAGIANRVSYFLNLHGPSLTLDTMCSSSLTALHLACQDLRLGRTSLALAGGVNVTIHPNKYTMLSGGQFISGDGHCQSFGEGGDGYIPGEGVGVAVLKRLSDAERDGNHIYGVIRASALNHGGKTNGYTVPNPQAQADVIRRALLDAGIDAADVSYVEAHGTGTKLGDPIEIAALTRAFGAGGQAQCLIGSAKSNIGHCESAAGIAGITKVLLQMRHRQIVPSLHSARLNPHIDFAATPFTVNQALRQWETPLRDGRPAPRIAGISSFGAGGANAHVIVEEYRAPAAPAVAARPVLVPLSARTVAQLEQRARDLLAALEDDGMALASVAYTLQVGREAMEERLALVAASLDELADGLRAFLAGGPAGQAFWRGQARKVDAADMEATTDLPRLAQLWVKGQDIDWRQLDDGAAPGLVSLPSYPFARERYWNAPVSVQAAAPALHPLVHANVSTLAGHGFATRFTGSEAFLDNGAGTAVLPPLLVLEMALAAVRLAAPRADDGTWTLHDVAWGDPVRAGADIGIAVFGQGDDAVDVEIHDGELVLCQAHARYAALARPTVDVAAQALEATDLGEHGEDGFALAPALCRAIGNWLDKTADGALPLALAQLQVFAPCPRQVLLAPHAGAEGAIDVDVCDVAGNVCVRLLGLALDVAEPAPEEEQEQEQERQPAPATPPREITLAAAAPVQSPVARKPAQIALGAGADIPMQPPARRPVLALADPASPAAAAPIRLFDRGDGVFVIEADAGGVVDLVDGLCAALAQAEREPGLKAVLLTARQAEFWHGDRAACNAVISSGLLRAIAAFPCPVIAVPAQGATGAGLLLAAVCDFMVAGEGGEYRYTGLEQGIFPSAAEERLFRARLGDAPALALLYRPTAPRGRGLQDIGWACPVASDPLAQARALAAELAKKPRLALSLLKTHLARTVKPLVDALSPDAPVVARTTPLQAHHGALRVQLEDRGSVSAMLDDLEAALANTDDHHSVIVTSAVDGFLPALDAAAATRLLHSVQACAVPVIVACEGDVRGTGWLTALAADAAAYRVGGNYGITGEAAAAFDARELAALAELRLGGALGAELCLAGIERTGAELAAYGLALASEDPLDAALAMAAFWHQWPRDTAVAWKQAQVAHLQAAMAALPRSAPMAQTAPVAQDRDGALALRSQVVTATAHPDGVIVVTMQDRAARNMFSAELVDGLKEVFALVASDPAIRVVVVTGYDSYFATGGTMETLLAIQEGQARFTDEKVFELALECPVPVIAAIQGHGIGGGWSFGMYADLVLLSGESRYRSPYMAYGFTPGAGSTLTFPAKIGLDLARETLLSAVEISGADLLERGMALPVLPRRDVLPAALALAHRIARQPRARLVELKGLCTHALRAARDDVYRREVAMHEQTFVGNTGTLAAIQARFGTAPETPAAPTPTAVPTGAAIDTLRQMLARELLLQPGEIGDDTPFIDLGLDSITGVTWIRKINEHFGTAIEATKVYSHPTLNEMARLVGGTSPAPVAAAPATAAPAVEPTGIVAHLRTMLARELLLDPGEIDDNAQFIDLGLDSITGVTWVRKINEHYGTAIEATKVYSHPSLADIATLVAQAAHVTTPAPPAPVVPAPVPRKAARAALVSWRGKPAPEARPGRDHTADRMTSPIAVIGMAGQFPQARNVDEFWANLAAGRDCIAEVAAERWNVAEHFQPGAPVAGKTYSKWLGALDDYDRFDPLFFNISPTEAECMEPQQRLFLQACWHAIEHAGYNPQALAGSQCGVFVGCGPSDYLQGAPAQFTAQGFTGAAASILAARISYFLNLRGPCISLDTACSSSLVAIAGACDSLNAGNSDVALAGGVYVMTGPAMHIMTAQAGMLSADGRCHTFDQGANGFVPGEAVGVVLLKRLADAERDGDRILGVLEGWGVNQDGKTNGITAPNEEAQARLLESVYRRFAIDPAQIGFVEAHGTGTKLGDPIEVAGLKAAFGAFTQERDYCALGSVKSNIGHCLPAAGAAGFIKLLLALQHRALPPTIHYQRCNEHIKLDGSPFRVNTRLQPWQGGRRRAAISSFGFSGTNAHLVVAEHVPAARQSGAVDAITEHGKVIVPLSARGTEQLRQAARNLLAHLRAAEAPVDLLDLAYTLQIGREAMGERLALLVDSVGALTAALDSWLAGQQPDGIALGSVKQHRESIRMIAQDDELRATIVAKWLGRCQLGKLMELWTKGLELDWTMFYGTRKPRRIGLPGYPFARDRYWIAAASPSAKTPVAASAPAKEEAPAWDGISYLQDWTAAPLPSSQTAPAPNTVLLVRTGPCFGLDAALAAHYAAGGARIVQVSLGDATVAQGTGERTCGIADRDGWHACLHDVGQVDALYFLASSEDAAPLDVRAAQESNEIQLLRLLKTLKRDGKGAAVDTWVVTVDNHGSTTPRCWGAGASGLAYAAAQGDHHFHVRNVDLDSADLANEAQRAALVAALAREPATDRGELVRLAGGQRYRQGFLRLEWDAAAQPGLRHGGVYVIAGGSGIVGRVMTRQLIERYDAHVIWLGRAEADAPRIREALASFDALPVQPEYVQADALDEAALRRALAAVRRKHGHVHGAIFASMVFGTENGIDRTSEEQFRDILEVKTLGSAAFYAALRDEPLDFLCFFSSGQGYAFSGASKLSAYATGITFGDSFVRAIRSDCPFPVGTINWGFWQAAVKERIEKLDNVSTRSLAALSDEEGFAAFERFVGALRAGRLHQVLCMRAAPEVAALMHCNTREFAALATGTAPVTLDTGAVQIDRERIAQLVRADAARAMDGWMAGLVLVQLERLRSAAGATLPCTVAELQSRCAIADKYEPWLRMCLALLARAGAAVFDGETIHRWEAPDMEQMREAGVRFRQDPATAALAVLVEECIDALPAVLRGDLAATDVVFPNGAMDKVAGLYRNNPTADTFNGIVAATVAAYVRRRLEADPAARIRILEIGAGTGGTSALVFDQLRPYAAAMAEYCYTDLSKAFFFHAERNYLPEHPYIVCRRLDIEQPLSAQGLVPGSYDLVLSTNALHATVDIRRTLRHAKSALHKDGFIVLSEMADSSLSTHLTFGLLDGWWRFEDAPLRIPGCPGLYPETWRRVLQEEGFSDVLLPGGEARALGSQVVVARSDGVIRLPLTAVPVRQAVPGVVAKRVRRVAAPVRGDLPRQVRDTVLDCLAATLKMPAAGIDAEIAFSDYGIDSILGVNFIDRVNARFGIALNTAVIFEYSSVERLARHLAEAHAAEVTAALSAQEVVEEVEVVEEAVAREASPAVAAPRAASHGPVEIAIVGMSGKFPKAGNVDAFWRNLVDGVDGVEEVPAHYLDQRTAFSTAKRKGKTRCKWAGVLAERDCFDPLFFSISPKEAESMNPHQRLVMQESWNALEDAGYNPKALAGSQTGIFIGAEPAGYVGDTFTGLSDAIIASRLSYALNFNGAAFVVNTGCSSSAVAIHLACENLRNGESDLVLAGGVNACMHQELLVRLDGIDMLSPSGRCHTFDKAADGTVISEGVGMLVLKRLDDALADGDHVYATICASGMNQDGASNGITAPNGVAQEQLIASVYDRFGIDPRHITYVEAHGTGTRLGDPVETNALVRAFRRYSNEQAWCAVGSAKSHIGHAAAAAGVIGIIKVLLSMRHGELPALLNFSEMNPLIQFDGSPFHLTRTRTPWLAAPGMPRMAALNSFGHSGTNVHLVLKQYDDAPDPITAPAGPLAVPLSARTPEQLRQRCADLLAVLASGDAPNLAALAYTLQVGREPMEERVGFVADSAAALARQLQAYLDGGTAIAGQAARTGGATVAPGGRSAADLLQQWVRGAAVDWQALWPRRPVRARLPGYPFAKERYWMADAFGSAPMPAAAPPERDGDAIERILDRILDDAISADEGVGLLKTVV
ncbi:ketoacyl-synthetase-like protein [Pseudoduganella flava]|uniref:Ketoacyl-synthetase-like protein n=1 Tax=Pseudoduganella flava TaxID=871742 RepID=A0A562PIE7_9BURK|nr:SDR family NAD(P)-dependent oxidoreductase [Pseudoduganella flava]QGZ37637.1 SDR family NAD(P)-dependent oxidoreductase [Pseudoduganella flava]TWI44000.1 ketoacyl-synthetase-like protein [Pseudoduganella flava]